MNPFRPLLLTGLLFSASLLAQQPSLSNLSSRAQVGTGGNIIISGFNIGPGGSKTVLVRASGPALAGFGVTGTLTDPRLELFNSSGVRIAENDNWNTPVGGASPLTVETFSGVGAFPWTNGSRDAALVATLAPGAYTAQVSGINNGTGVALIEVYEVGAGTSRLSNLSTRAQVGTGGNILIPGIVVSPGTGVRRLLIRAAGPALTPLGVAGALANPTLLVTNAAGTPAFTASNDNWGTPVGTGAAPAADIAAAARTAGAFPFANNSNDAALIVDLRPGSYTIQTSGVNNATGVALVEVYDLTPAVTPIVTVVATRAAADESGRNPGEFTFFRTGDLTFPLTVNYTVGGSAINGFDYPALLGTLDIPAGAASAALPLSPNPDVQNEGTDTVSLTVSPRFNYVVGAQASATVTIADSPATLFIAPIRTTANAVGGSTASGYASILLSSSGTLAAVNVTFTGLSSTQVTAHLVIGANDDYVLDLPNGHVNGVQWHFTPTGAYTGADLLAALRNGNIGVRIDSAKFPGGELKGVFISGAGSQNFTPPAAPPAAPPPTSANEAARFLTQATFGPTKAEIDALTGGNVDAWITAQLALPFTSHRTATTTDRATFGGSSSFTNWNAIHPPNRQSAWFKTVLTAPDQLRQRMAYALSQILVISDITLADDSRTEPVAHFHDQLGNGAFGNFRALLETVTLSPMMGEYLSSLRNSKATFDAGGNAITTPDENYAREIMQLFTIGLVRLQPDGSLQLGPDGLPIPTYTQETITELAKVFTGWSYFNTNTTNANNFRGGGSNYINPMSLFPAFHDNTAKNLAPVSPTPIPANSAADSGVTDLRLALDALFNHPNTAPFISKLLIQRLVTSNPSPGYVYRVAQKFENNGSGVRGDLAAVARAILTDYEARSPEVASNVSFGKLKEPLLRLTALMRGFGASSPSGRILGYRHHVNNTVITSATPRPATQGEIGTFSSSINLFNVRGSIAQAALRSTTVFNFYHADYVQPGPLAAAGLVAPEFEITDDNFAISVPNYLRTIVISTPTNVAATIQPYVITLNTTYEESLLATPAALIDHLGRVLAAGTISDAVRTRITAALAALPAATTPRDRVNTAILLVLTSPAASIQK